MRLISNVKLNEISTLVKDILKERKNIFAQAIEGKGMSDDRVNAIDSVMSEVPEYKDRLEYLDKIMSYFDQETLYEFRDHENYDLAKLKTNWSMLIDLEILKKFDDLIKSMFYFDRINITEYDGGDDHYFICHLSLLTGLICLKNSIERRSLNSISDDLVGPDILEKVVDNYYLLEPPVIRKRIKIPEHIKILFAESRWCFVLSKHHAAVALCRAIIEIAIKDKINNYDMIKNWGASRCLENAKKEKIISDDMFDAGRSVNSIGNKLMHASEVIGNEQALAVIEKTKYFLEGLYGTRKLDLSINK
jgi:hypothetical protein